MNDANKVYNLTGKELDERIKSDMSKLGKTVCVDFDGVIHPYTKGWQGLTPTIEAPVKGIKEELGKLQEAGYSIVVFTTRAQSDVGEKEVRKYLTLWKVPFDGITASKIGAHCYIDDRAVCFDGQTEGLADKVINFKPWTEKK